MQKYKNIGKFWDLQRNLIQFFLDKNDMKDEFKIILWRRFSIGLTDFLNENLFEFRIEKNAEIVNKWLMWPLDKTCIEDGFLSEWKILSEAASTAEGKSHFVQYLVEPLKKVFDDNEGKCSRFVEVLAHFINTLEYTFENSSKPTAAFELISHVLSKPSKVENVNYNKILEAFTNYINKLNENQIIDAFPSLKQIFSTVVQTANSGSFTKTILEEFKRVFQDKLKSNKAKEKKLLKEIKDLMKNDSYVIIPTVWSLKPDKLTEHQKEKMKEKRNDIPALYNDMSQSQDTSSTSIKPWTPKKIVIAKGKDSGEIVLENRSEDDIATAETEDIPPSSHIDDVFVSPLPVAASAQKVNSKTPESASKKDSPKTDNGDSKKGKKMNLKDSEKILNKLNIEVEDEEKRLHILRQLKSIEIDTVEGNTVVTGKLRNRQSAGKQPPSKKRSNNTQLSTPKRSKSSNEDKDSENTENQKKDAKPPRKLLTNEKSKENEEIDSSDEIIASSQASESVLSKKLPSRKSFNSNIRTEMSSNLKNKPEDSKKKENINAEIYDFNEDNDEEQKSKNTVSPAKSRNSISPKILNKLQEKNANAEDSSNNNKIQSLSNGFDTALKPAEMKKLSEQETQPNTELIENTSPQIRSPHLYKSLEQQTDSPSNTLQKADKSPFNTSKNSLNHSILSSPEDKDTDERNAELMNSTLNISPILIEAKNDNNDQKAMNEDAIKLMKLLKPSPVQMPSSPPERKPTNNSESPAHRPKVSSQFTGRGARLINMIRNKTECAVPKPQLALMAPDKAEEKCSAEQANQKPQSSPPKQDQATAPALHKDLLFFSKVLPSPDASPSASILKRKFRRTSLDDIESPLNKRKRVSFHDPPVSLRKEYVKTAEEEKFFKANRCLLPDKSSTPLSPAQLKHSLKRKNRIDSMVEISKFTDPSSAHSTPININFGAHPNTTFGQTSVDMSSLKWNNTTNENGDDNETSLTPSPSMYFTDDNAVISHVIDKYPFETILEKYLESGKTLTNKSIHAVTSKISTQMTTDAKLKTKVLEILSEKHPKEFLEHAIQENLSFAVCNHLNFNSIIEYVCEKSKNTEQLRKALLDRIQCTLNNEKLSTEVHAFVVSLLKNHHMTDQEIVSCIDVIMERHRQNK